MMKRLLSLLTCGALLLGLLAACGAPAKSSSAAEPGGAASAPGQRQEVKFWYLWGGTEEQVLLKAIDAYNASQDTYRVVGAMTDIQAQTAGMASSSGPDITDIIDVNVAGLAANGAVMALDDFIARDGYDTSDFNGAAMELCSYQDKLYGLPLNAMINMIYYNKAAFEKAGVTSLPTTMEELFDTACALTVTDENGAIQQLGWPWMKDPTPVEMFMLAAQFGGSWVSEDGKTATCDSAAILEAYDYFMRYVDKYGRDNIEAFVGQYSGTDATSQDPLFTGAAAMRMDGMYLYVAMGTNGYDAADFGVFPMPTPADQPQLAGTQHVTSSIFVIPQNAANKEGAWDFLKWVCSEEGMSMIDAGFQNEPSRMSLLDSAALSGNNPFYQDFVSAGQQRPVARFPSVAISDKYMDAVDSATDDIFNGRATAADAMAKVAQEMTAALQKAG